MTTKTQTANETAIRELAENFRSVCVEEFVANATRLRDEKFLPTCRRATQIRIAHHTQDGRVSCPGTSGDTVKLSNLESALSANVFAWTYSKLREITEPKEPQPSRWQRSALQEMRIKGDRSIELQIAIVVPCLDDDYTAAPEKNGFRNTHFYRAKTDLEILREGKEFAELQIEGFVNKLLAKFEGLGNITSTDFDGVTQAGGHSGGWFEFDSGLRFRLSNRPVYGTSCNQTPYMQWPTRFHDVTLNGVKVKPTESAIKKAVVALHS